MPTFQPEYSFSISDWLSQNGVEATIHCLPQQAIFGVIAEIKCELLQVKEERTDLPEGTMSNMFLVRKPGTIQPKKLMLPVLLS